MFKFGRTEKSILGAVSIVLLIFCYLLVDDSWLFPSDTKDRTNSIGNLSFIENDVRRKSSENFSWLPALSKDGVFQQDSIFTGNDSNAEVTLSDGSVIEIQPNSLVTLNVRNGQMSLNLSYGNFVGQVAQGSSLTIQSGDEEFKLKGDRSKIQFKKKNTGNVDMQLLSGQASVSNKSGKNIALKKAVEEAPKIDLLLADGSTITKLKTSDPVLLQWKGQGAIAKYQVQISRDPQMTSSLNREATKNQKFDATSLLDSGTYYWQVKALRADGSAAAQSEVRHFSVSTFASPQITSPQTQAVFSQELPGKLEDLQSNTKITWETPTDYTQYRVQISKDADFKAVIKDVLTPAKESMTPNLPSGTYYTRVLGTIPDKKITTQWSKAVSFTFQLQALKEQPPEPPTLVSEKVFYPVPKNHDRSPAAVPGPSLAWKSNAPVPQYRLQIAKDKDFTLPSEFTLTEPKMEWSRYRPGKYFYRVYSVSASGMVSVPSNTGEVFIHVDSPTLSTVEAIHLRGSEAPPSQQLHLSWSEVPFAKNYLVQYDADEKFTHPKQLSFSGTTGEVTIPQPGKYHVRVKAVDEANTVVGGYSNPQLAIYTYDNPLATPVLHEPFDKTSIFLQKESSPYVWLEWKNVDGAQKYLLEISASPEFAKILVSQTTTDTRYLINKPLPTGKVYWRVRALSVESKSESDWSPLREFTLFQKKNEIFVQ